jgi:hypothetical protein
MWIKHKFEIVVKFMQSPLHVASVQIYTFYLCFKTMSNENLNVYMFPSDFVSHYLFLYICF